MSCASLNKRSTRWSRRSAGLAVVDMLVPGGTYQRAASAAGPRHVPLSEEEVERLNAGTGPHADRLGTFRPEQKPAEAGIAVR